VTDQQRCRSLKDLQPCALSIAQPKTNMLFLLVKCILPSMEGGFPRRRRFTDKTVMRRAWFIEP
jgi:hypothetical protein